jgi:hypothetical protein
MNTILVKVIVVIEIMSEEIIEMIQTIDSFNQLIAIGMETIVMKLIKKLILMCNQKLTNN